MLDNHRAGSPDLPSVRTHATLEMPVWQFLEWYPQLALHTTVQKTARRFLGCFPPIYLGLPGWLPDGRGDWSNGFRRR